MDPSLAPRAREALELRGASKNRAFALSSLRRFYRSRYSGRLRALYEAQLEVLESKSDVLGRGHEDRQSTPQTATNRFGKGGEWLPRAARASETRRASTMASSTEKGRVPNEASHASPWQCI